MKSNTILDTIVQKKAKRLADKKEQLPPDALYRQAEKVSRKPLDFCRYLKREGRLSIIAEVKKASPSKGVIREDFSPVAIAKDYIKSGVQAISVLTEEDFFKGADRYLQDIRRISPVPLLRKDFLFDPYQICEAFVLGADAVLLIAALLDDPSLERMHRTALDFGLQALVEVHNEEELQRVLSMKTPASAIGINNRDLSTFQEDLATTKRLIEKIPGSCCIVSESGIRTAMDMASIKEWGANAVLIGETLMRSGDIPLAVAGLRKFIS